MSEVSASLSGMSRNENGQSRGEFAYLATVQLPPSPEFLFEFAVKLEGILARLFGQVHCFIGLFDQLLDIFSIIGEN